MRKTLIIGTLMALFGLATAVQASDYRRTGIQDDTQVTRAASNDIGDEQHGRYERNDRSRERHDGSHERRHHSRDGHDESREHGERR